MRPAVVVLLPLLAAGVGVGAWLALRPGPSRPAGTAPRDASPAVDPDFERRLQEATDLIKRADEAQGDERKTRAREAAEALDALERSRPEDADVAYWRGFAALLSGDADAAHTALDRLRARSRDRGRAPAVALLQASIQLAFEPDKLEAAVRTLKGLPSRAPKFRPEQVAATTYKALRLWARRNLETRNGESALRALEEAKKLVENDPAQFLEVRLAIAHALGWNARWPEATEAWLALEKETHGENPEVEMGLGDAYAIQNQDALAAEHFTRVIEIMGHMKDPPPAYLALSEALLRRGNAFRLLGKDGEAKARADLEGYVARFPKDSRGWYWLGVFRYDQLEDTPGARAAFETARALSPWCDQYLRRLVQTVDAVAPDSEESKALRKELDSGAADRTKKREEIQRERGDMRNVCE